MVGELFLLFRRETAVGQAQELAESHDGVQRSAHLVAHVLHETGLGRVRELGFFVGFPENTIFLSERAQVDGEEGDDGHEEDGEKYHHQACHVQHLFRFVGKFLLQFVIAQAGVQLGNF